MDRSENVGHRVQVDAFVVWGSWWPTSSQEPALGQFPWGMAHKPPPTPPQLPYHYSATLGNQDTLAFIPLWDPVCLGGHTKQYSGECVVPGKASYMKSPCYLSDPGT